MENRGYAGGPLDWLTPFAVFCGLGLIAAYALLGCTWLIMKTGGELQRRMHDIGIPLLGVLLAVIGIVSLWTPLAHGRIAERWFSLPNLFWFLPVPILVLLCSWALYRAIQRYAHYSPFLLTLALIFLGYSGLGISCGRTSFRQRSASGTPPRRRKARASRWWARCSSCRSC